MISPQQCCIEEIQIVKEKQKFIFGSTPKPGLDPYFLNINIQLYRRYMECISSNIYPLYVYTVSV